MELFRYRKLALGCGCFLLALAISFYLNNIIKAAILVTSGIAFILLVTVYLIKRSSKALSAIISFGASLLLIILAMVVSMISFNGSSLQPFCDGELHTVEATVTDVTYESDYIGFYTIKTHRVDKNVISESAKLSAYGTALTKGDTITIKGYLTDIQRDPFGFDEESYNLSKGIYVSVDATDCEVSGHKSTPVFDTMERVNDYLDERLTTIDDEDTYSLLTALFLGNKDALKDSTKRDFSRLGLSHVLALSGMHITIIVTILGLALEATGIRKVYKEIILILSTLFFVGMTGFSDSAMRAGIMVCLSYLLSFFGGRMNTITSLFVSVTLICIINPYSIFSLSLILSFFAMIGCLISAKFAHRVRLFKKIRSYPLRFLILNLMTSTLAILFTLPIIYQYFGSIALLSPLSNLLLSPLFTILIYLSPVYIVCSYIPYVSQLLAWFLKQIVSFLLFVGEKASLLDGIVIPISNYVQIAGIFIVLMFLMLFAVARKRAVIPMLCGALCGVVTFVVGTGILHCHRNSNVYAGTHSKNGNEIVFVEDKNSLTLFDMNTDEDFAYYTVVHLGYCEIDRYVITDYTVKTYSTLNKLSDSTIVREIYLPSPLDEGDEEALQQIYQMAATKGIKVSILEDTLILGSSCAEYNYEMLGRSTKRGIILNITVGNTSFAYLGAATFEAASYTPAESAYTADILVFGSYGPKFKVNYTYETPCVDYCVFLGNSFDYAREDFYEKIHSTVLPNTDYPHRFRLNP